MSETDPIASSPEAPPAGSFPAEQPIEVKPIESRKIAVVGEIPFAGKALVQALLRNGFSARVLCPDEAAELAVLSAGGNQAGMVEIVRGSLESSAAIDEVLKGAYGLCFLSPITFNGRIHRAREHVEDVKRVAQAAQNGAIRKLVYHSALGAHLESRSRALQQAAEAEEIIHAAKCEDFRVRTGPVMGRGDGYLTEMVRTIKSPSPLMRILGYGATTVQPIHVNDMAECIARIFAEKPEELRPGHYSLAGPETTTELDLIDHISSRLKRSKLRIHIPLFLLQFWLSLSKGSGFHEQVNLLFDIFYTDQNDAPKLLSSGKAMITPAQAQEEILAS